ncbi:MAG: hypothetical protein V1776_01460 [Candidatus Diapherotrites archaeon]
MSHSINAVHRSLILVLIIFFVGYFFATFLSDGMKNGTIGQVTSPALSRAPILHFGELEMGTIQYAQKKDGYLLVGQPSDIEYPFMVSILTTDEIKGMEIKVDNASRPIGLYSIEKMDNSQIVTFEGFSSNFGWWVPEGKHTVEVTVSTEEYAYQNRMEIDVDYQTPTFQREKNNLTITDQRPITKVEMFLFDRMGAEEPRSLLEKEGHTDTVHVSLDETDSFVEADSFRVVYAMDEAGNTGVFVPDDSRSAGAVLGEYTEQWVKRILEQELEQISLESTMEKPEFGPIFVVSSTDRIQGWTTQDKTLNISSTILSSEPILKKAVKDNGFTSPEYDALQFHNFTVISPQTAKAEFGLLEVYDDDLKSRIIQLDRSDAASTSIFLDKMTKIRNDNIENGKPNSIPIFVVDDSKSFPNPNDPALPPLIEVMSYEIMRGHLIINYKTLVDPHNSWAYQIGYASRTFAHEMGHTYGLGHSGNPNNLMRQGASGTRLTFDQSAVIAAHSLSSGLKTAPFGIWRTHLEKTKGEDVCSNGLFDDGGLHSLIEECEDTYSGKVDNPPAMRYAEIDNWKVTIDGKEYFYLKYCPIKMEITAAGKKEIVNPPVAVPQDFDEFSAMIDTYDEQENIPILELAIPPSVANRGLGIQECGCYTICEYVCKLADLPDADNAKFFCSEFCNGDPDFIISNAEKIKAITPQLNSANGESCAASTDTLSNPDPQNWRPNGNFGNSSNDFCSPKDDCEAVWGYKSDEPLECDFARCLCIPKGGGSPPIGGGSGGGAGSGSGSGTKSD